MAEEHPSRSGCALVTGGGVRLGATIVRRLAADGWAVAIHARKEDAAEVFAKEMTALGHRVAAVSGDLSEPDAAAKIFAQVGAKLGPCSFLVNSAAAFAYSKLVV
jgi:NAD(P)-dependent dehydrogenase (short-subunit alcohol dehydrogenase family)